MRRKLLFLAALVGICTLSLDRPAAAISVCGVTTCRNGGSCICPAGTIGAGNVADCASWYPDCRNL
jgi:hypothetical protein